MHTENTFITLTYSPEHYPEDGSLCLKHFQDFMKRLRKSIAPKKIRFFHCGEYGEKLNRPHYHALLFGHDFPDRTLWQMKRGSPIYISKQLQNLWPLGFTTLSDVNFQTAAYVSRYILKKQNGEKAITHYQKIDPITGELYQIAPEYTTMSRAKGIGSTWFDKFESDVFPSDEVVLQGKKIKTPKYYSRIFEEAHADAYKEIVEKRKTKAKQFKQDNTPERLQTRHNVALAKLKNHKRNFE